MGPDDIALQLPNIDFSGLELNKRGSDGWDTVRSQVLEALRSWGCFQAIFDKVSTELRNELFGTAAKELFGLPVETKMQNVSNKSFQGYIGQIPGWAYESLVIDDAPLLEGSQAFTNLMWPDGNPTFCNTVWTFAKHLQELEQMVRMMVLEGLGVEEHFESFVDSTYSAVRLMEYGARSGANAHNDMNVLNIICQHQVGGLEVETKDGRWIHVPPTPNSFTVFIGESFQAWSNGRLEPTYHRVVNAGNEKRYSAAYGVSLKDGYFVQAPEELVDEEHPRLYEPYDYAAYLQFRFSEEGERAPRNALKTYCGVERGELGA